jgi:hypothetical protein
MCFLSHLEDRSKRKTYTQNKYDHIHTQMENVFVTVELLYGIQRKEERKKE